MNRVVRATRARQFVVLLALGLAGCKGFGGAANAQYTCPAATTIPELQTIARLAPNGSDDSIQSAGRIASVTSSCEDEDAGIATKLSIDFSALRTGPGIKRVELPYFVAIADSTGNILGKQLFAIAVEFPDQAPTVRTTEKVTAHLPLKNPQLGNVYTIIVGFQLSKNEIDFNRAHLQ